MYKTGFLTLFLAVALTLAHPHHIIERAVSPDSTCGSANGFTCAGSTPCCSQWGWCGSDGDYCGTGCQSNFGTCDGGDSGGSNNGGGDTGGGDTGGSTGGNTGGGNGAGNSDRPKIGSVPYGSIITQCVNAGDIALTFDDGPSPFTQNLLDMLGRNNIKATFFVLGQSPLGEIDQSPEASAVIRRAFNEGHQIGSHTWSHPDLTTISSTQRRQEMYRLEGALANIIGVIPTYMRPPYLAFDGATGSDMADLGYHVISTNLDTRDWANQTPDTIGNSKATFEQSILSNPASSNFIVLTHDIHRTTVENLVPYEIRRLQARGYRPVTVGQCLNDPVSNWYRSP